MTPLETLLARLPDAKKTGNNWSARCPAHDDRRASLSIAQGDGGTVLVKCHAGCDTATILAAVGMRLADLFPPKHGSKPTCDAISTLTSSAFRSHSTINGPPGAASNPSNRSTRTTGSTLDPWIRIAGTRGSAQGTSMGVVASRTSAT